jgi:hypothetical protein
MSELKLPESIDNALANATGKVSETAGELFDAALTYVGRNVIKRYKFNRADDDFQLAAYKQAQEHALKLQEIKNKKVEQYYGEYIDQNIQTIASKALRISNNIPEECRLTPNLGFIGPVLEDAKYQQNDNLQEMYAELLASSVDSRKIRYAHPAFSNTLGSLSELDAQNIHLIHERGRTIAKAVITSETEANPTKEVSPSPEAFVSFVSVKTRSTYPEIMFIAHDLIDDLPMQAMSLQTLKNLGLIDFSFFEGKWYFEVDSDEKYASEKQAGHEWVTTEIDVSQKENCAEFFTSGTVKSYLQSLAEKESRADYKTKAGLVFGYVQMSPYGKSFMLACSCEQSRQTI